MQESFLEQRRPVLVNEKGKIYLKSYYYNKMYKRKFVDFSKETLKTFVSQDLKDFSYICKQSAYDEQEFPNINSHRASYTFQEDLEVCENPDYKQQQQQDEIKINKKQKKNNEFRQISNQKILNKNNENQKSLTKQNINEFKKKIKVQQLQQNSLIEQSKQKVDSYDDYYFVQNDLKTSKIQQKLYQKAKQQNSKSISQIEIPSLQIRKPHNYQFQLSVNDPNGQKDESHIYQWLNSERNNNNEYQTSRSFSQQQQQIYQMTNEQIIEKNQINQLSVLNASTSQLNIQTKQLNPSLTARSFQISQKKSINISEKNILLQEVTIDHKKSFFNCMSKVSMDNISKNNSKSLQPQIINQNNNNNTNNNKLPNNPNNQQQQVQQNIIINKKNNKEYKNIQEWNQIDSDTGPNIMDAQENTPFTILSKVKFNNNFKNIKKIIEQNTFYNQKNSLQTILIKEQLERNILPDKMGIVNPQQYSLNISNLNQKVKGSILINGISTFNQNQISYFEKINIKNNKMGDIQLSELIKQLPKEVGEINIVYNDFQLESCKIISEMYLKLDSKLQILNLEGNKISDKGAEFILHNLYECQKLKVLNLSVNLITQLSAASLKSAFTYNTSLEQIYLHWNMIREEGCEQIFQGLQKHPNLLVFDISNNALGGGQKPFLGAHAIKNYLLSTDQSIIHIDLSRNGFTKEESLIISEGLNKSNCHNLYGFHFSGNQGIVNPLGYLTFPSHGARQFNVKQRINGVQRSGISYKGEDLTLVETCWICEGWEEHFFSYRIRDPSQDDKVFLHVNFLMFEPLEMELEQGVEKSGYYKLSLMCPPKKEITYFFTIPNRQLQEFDENKPSKSIGETLQNAKQEFLYQDIKLKMDQMSLMYLNYFKTGHQFVYDFENFLSFVVTHPRQEKIRKSNHCVSVKDGSMKEEKQYKTLELKESIWRHYPIFEDMLQKQSMEQDIKASNIQKIVLNESNEIDLQNLKIVFASKYYKIRDIFREYSSYEPYQNRFVITRSQFSLFAAKSRLVDNKYLKVTDIDIEFAQLLQEYKKEGKEVIGQGLFRYMFLELLVRLSKLKYIQNNLTNKFCLGLKQIVESDGLFEMAIRIPNPQKWREKYLWTCQTEEVIKEYYQFIFMLFDYYGKHQNGKNLNKIMKLDNFQKIFEDLKDKETTITTHHVNLAFHNSFIPLKEDLKDEQEKFLNILEFCEALARTAIQNNYLPKSLKVGGADNVQESNDQILMPLKLEGLLQYLYMKLPVDQYVKKNNCYESIFKQILEVKGLKNQCYELQTKQQQRLQSLNLQEILSNKIDEKNKKLFKNQKSKINNDLIQTPGTNFNLKSREIDDDNQIQFKIKPQSISTEKKKMEEEDEEEKEKEQYLDNDKKHQRLSQAPGLKQNKKSRLSLAPGQLSSIQIYKFASNQDEKGQKGRGSINSYLKYSSKYSIREKEIKLNPINAFQQTPSGSEEEGEQNPKLNLITSESESSDNEQ